MLDRVIRWLSMIVALSVLGGPGLALADADESRWRGVAEVGPVELEFQLTFTRTAEGAWNGLIDVPVQGITAGELRDVELTEERLTFGFDPPGTPFPAEFTFELAEDGTSGVGELRQAGQTFPATLERLKGGERVTLERPQHPEPPFPYPEEEVEFTNPDDGTTLAGTLTLPERPGPHPAAILISGSGAQDRDETLLGHKPFLVIADHLTRHGIAVLRYDDRGVGDSTGSVREATIRDTAADVAAAMELLGSRDDIDADRIGLIGHSEGGIVAPLVASERDGVAFIVMLAGTGVPGDELLRMQNRALLEASGVPEATIESQIEQFGACLELILEDASDDRLSGCIAELARMQSPGMNQSLIDQQVEMYASPWFRSIIKHDPRESLREVRCPVLALIGSLDLQVPADENLAGIRAALDQAGNAEATVRELEGLNHLFQNAETGHVGEYGSITETFDPETLELIASWIAARTGLSAGPTRSVPSEPAMR